MDLSPSTAALKARLDAKPGAVAELAQTRGREPKPLALIYKLAGRMFAILGVRGGGDVNLKCDPHLIEILKAQYAGVGHRGHLDRRHWICVSLDTDLPAAELERLVDGSYDLIRANLTRKQQAELAAETRA